MRNSTSRSGSEQDAAGEFLKDAMRTNLDKAMVLSFDSNAEMVSEPTPDTDKLDSAIRGLHAGGGTALYDAILYGLPRQTGPGTTQL